MRTTATYDINSKQFILNSPDFQAAKCWIVSLGSSATHMVVFAKLITPDGVNHGLHWFIVQIRCLKTFIPYPGVKIVPMGEKIGMHGLDPGTIMFIHHRIPRENLLNKLADVNEIGEYVTNIYNSKRRFALMLASLSKGRIIITGVSTSILTKAIAIAIRHDFSIQESFEQKCRLLPYLSSAYAFHVFLIIIYGQLFSIKDDRHGSEEMHAILSSCKPVCSWNAQRGIEECIEICRGCNFKEAILQELRKDHDAALTGEGDNHVIIQQTGNWLLRFWPLVVKKQKIQTPLNSISFLNNAEEILNEKVLVATMDDVMHPKYILNTFKWLICYLLKTHFKTSLEKSVNGIFKETLAIVYIQHFILENMFKKVSSINDNKLKNILLKLFSLYGVCCLAKHVSILYVGQYATAPSTALFIQEAIIHLCSLIESQAIDLANAIAQPDSITYFSRISKFDKHINTAMMNACVTSKGPIGSEESGRLQQKSKL